MSSGQPSSGPSPGPASANAPTAVAHRDSFSDVDSQLGELVRELAAPPADHERASVLLPGTAIAQHFEVVRKLGMGGMGVVYLVRDLRLDREIALKLLAPRRSAAGSVREAGTARLEREAQAMAQLAHPNVVTVHEVGRHDGGVYVAMEYVDGGTARQWAQERTRTIAEIVEVYLQAARGLAAAHVAGFVHRDFKPDNVLIGRDVNASHGVGRVRVADFGLARTWGSNEERVVAPPSAPVSLEPRSRPSVPQLTATDAVVGTPGYMAPEQFGGGELGPALDQFAWGVALFEALFGERPYGTLPSWAATAEDLRVPARAASHERVPAWLRTIVLRAIMLDPRARFPSMQAVVVALERGRLQLRRRTIAVVSTLAIVGAVGMGIGLGRTSGTPACDDAEAIAKGRWNDAVRAEIERRLETDDPLTRRTWAVAAPMIDDWVARWVEDRRDACIATRVHGSQSEQLLDRAVVCLDERFADLGALVDGLASDPRVRAAADAHAAALHETASCRDRAYLLARVAMPTDAALRTEVLRIQDELRKVRLGLDEGASAELGQRLHELGDAARRTEYAPVIAAVDIESGRLELAADRRDEAGARLRRAYFTARAAGDDESAADAALLLAFLAGSAGTDRATAEIWLDHVAADLARGTVPGEIGVGLETARCQVLQRAGAHAEAIAAAGAALAACDEVGAPPMRVLGVRNELAAALDEAGRHREAIAEYDTLLDDTVTLYGPDHPRVAQVLTNRGLAHYYLQQLDRAVADQQRALEIHLAHEGLTGETAGVLLNLGISQLLAGRVDEARPSIEQALDIWRNANARPEQALALSALGWLELERQRPGAALAHYEEALAIHRELLPPGHPQLSTELSQVGDAQLELGYAEAAVKSYAEALAIWTTPELRDHPGGAVPEAGMAVAMLDLRRPDEALRHAEAAIELGARAEVEPATLVRARWVRARVWALQQRMPAAIAEARAALEQARTVQGSRTAEEIAAWLRDHDAP